MLADSHILVNITATYETDIYSRVVIVLGSWVYHCLQPVQHFTRCRHNLNERSEHK